MIVFINTSRKDAHNEKLGQNSDNQGIRIAHPHNYKCNERIHQGFYGEEHPSAVASSIPISIAADTCPYRAAI
jgi:hypothetical protein